MFRFRKILSIFVNTGEPQKLWSAGPRPLANPKKHAPPTRAALPNLTLLRQKGRHK